MELVLTIRTTVTDENNAREKYQDLKAVLDRIMELTYTASVSGTIKEGIPE